MHIKLSHCFTQVKPTDIVRVEAIRNYCKIYFRHHPKAFIFSITLLKVEEQLPADMFIRVHRSHLINKMHIKHLKGKPAQQVEMSNGEYIPVSRRKAAMVKKPILLNFN